MGLVEIPDRTEIFDGARLLYLVALCGCLINGQQLRIYRACSFGTKGTTPSLVAVGSVNLNGGRAVPDYDTSSGIIKVMTHDYFSTSCL